MLDRDTAGVIRLVGVAGFAVSVMVLIFAERTRSRTVLASVGKGTALLFAIIYFFGVMLGADSGTSRLVPHFP
jgi:hypothetical protein